MEGDGDVDIEAHPEGGVPTLRQVGRDVSPDLQKLGPHLAVSWKPVLGHAADPLARWQQRRRQPLEVHHLVHVEFALAVAALALQAPPVPGPLRRLLRASGQQAGQRVVHRDGGSRCGLRRPHAGHGAEEGARETVHRQLLPDGVRQHRIEVRRHSEPIDVPEEPRYQTRGPDRRVGRPAVAEREGNRAAGEAEVLRGDGEVLRLDVALCALQHAEDPIRADRHEVELREDALHVRCELLAHPQAVLDSEDKHVDAIVLLLLKEPVQATRELLPAHQVQRRPVRPRAVDVGEDRGDVSDIRLHRVKARASGGRLRAPRRAEGRRPQANPSCGERRGGQRARRVIQRRPTDEDVELALLRDFDVRSGEVPGAAEPPGQGLVCGLDVMLRRGALEDPELDGLAGGVVQVPAGRGKALWATSRRRGPTHRQRTRLRGPDSDRALHIEGEGHGLTLRGEHDGVWPQCACGGYSEGSLSVLEERVDGGQQVLVEEAQACLQAEGGQHLVGQVHLVEDGHGPLAQAPTEFSLHRCGQALNVLNLGENVGRLAHPLAPHGVEAACHLREESVARDRVGCLRRQRLPTRGLVDVQHADPHERIAHRAEPAPLAHHEVHEACELSGVALGGVAMVQDAGQPEAQRRIGDRLAIELEGVEVAVMRHGDTDSGLLPAPTPFSGVEAPDELPLAAEPLVRVRLAHRRGGRCAEPRVSLEEHDG
mmetsp:Transcript_29494/g.84789  ORF Transcript_29494/g.84789 Transcript_29494/m.84789 type:complete len:711 (+) Transcript_29494:1916-4048(+)